MYLEIIFKHFLKFIFYEKSTKLYIELHTEITIYISLHCTNKRERRKAEGPSFRRHQGTMKQFF